MSAITTTLCPIISLVPQASPSSFNTRTRKLGCLLNPQTRRSNFLRGRISSHATPSNSPYEEGPNVGLEESRPPKSYNATVWGDYFHSITPIENEKILENEHQILKENVRWNLLSSRNEPRDHLKLIDAIERLGVAYHFKDEIEESLDKIYNNYNAHEADEQHDLYYTSLKFRVLRQHGFYVSCDCFKKFIDENGTFYESLATDTLGILSLFEASHVRLYREEILEEALSFTTRHLKKIKLQTNNPLLEEVNHALSRPLQKSVVRLEAKHHIMMYQCDPSHNETLLKFAKIDFNILQSLHKKELQEITRWWERLRYAENFPYARDRLVENYFFGMAIVYEPKYSLSRMIFTKVAVWHTISDDLYDSHGTDEELKVLTEAIERWDKSCTHGLPDYIKVFYEGMLDDFDQYENDIVKAGNPNYIGYLIEEVKDITRSFMKAFKCSHAKKNATKFEEYIRHGMIAIGQKLLIGCVMVAMGDEVKEEDLECLSLLPNVIRSHSLIARLLNDIVGYETDMVEGIVSSVFCYMEQYGVSKEQAFADIRQRIEAEWIEMNEQMCLYPRTRLRRLLWRLALPMAQIPYAIYDGEDGFRMVKNIMGDYISRTLVDPIKC